MNHIVNRCLHPISVPSVTGVDAPLLRCGKCPNCLRQRRNEFAARAYMEFVGQKVSFFTFTYDNAKCPVYHRHMEVDSETGEVFKESEYISEDSEFFELAPFEVKRVIKKNVVLDVKRFHPLIEYKEVGFRTIYVDVRYQTIYYEHIKRLFKRFRAAFGVGSLSKFVCVPEYGANGYRPHYHLMTYGLTDKQEEFLINDWQKVRCYGHVDLRHPKFGEEGKVSAYLAKYCTKGDFDCPYIKLGYCIKPRRAVSANFGCGNKDAWQQLYYTLIGADFLGVYDPVMKDVTQLTDKDLAALARRRCFNFNGFHYPLPKYFVRKIFYSKDKVVYDSKGHIIKYISDYANKEKYQKNEGEVIKYRLRASELQKKVASIILGNLVADFAGIKDKDRHNKLFDCGDGIEAPYITPAEDLSEKIAESYFISDLERQSYY